MPPRRPPRGLSPRIETVSAGELLRRIYSPRRFLTPRPHTVGATTFRRFGPLERFDHHEPGVPGADADHGIYYAGVDVWDCALEVFARVGRIRLSDNRFAEVVVREPLSVVDLRGDGAIAIGADATLSKGGPRAATQAWARYVYDNPHVFSHDGRPVDGLLFSNAHNDGRSYALFERASGKLDRHSDRALRSKELHTLLDLRVLTAPALDVEP